MEHMLTLPENSFPVGLRGMRKQFNSFVTYPHFMKKGQNSFNRLPDTEFMVSNLCNKTICFKPICFLHYFTHNKANI